jgi:hypothetical protein
MAFGLTFPGLALEASGQPLLQQVGFLWFLAGFALTCVAILFHAFRWGEARIAALLGAVRFPERPQSSLEPLTFIAVMAYCTRAMRHRFLTGTPATFKGGACLRASQH